MLESSLQFLRCVGCGSKLELNAYKIGEEIEEGILGCKKCNLEFPIIEKIPVLWDNFSQYLSSRKVLGGKLFRLVQTEALKKFLKSSLSKIDPAHNDRTALEERWSVIYQNSKSSKFYSFLKNNLNSIEKSSLVVEYGCSVGTVTSFLAESHETVFGIDRSFAALMHAKRMCKNNLDYVVSDILSPVFGRSKFDLVLALNILELVEPVELLNHVSKQISSGYFVITDPYDFDRGANSVKKPLDETTLRMNLKNLGFKILPKTKIPSNIPWNLNLNSRATLNYEVDLVIGKK
ncbi:MAG: methyltransferase domain-containing protein [Nitrosopumilus sp.]|nr:MAG: methyltransferase domain-containing protein [Nitrosopumilus sp.]